MGERGEGEEEKRVMRESERKEGGERGGRQERE